MVDSGLVDRYVLPIGMSTPLDRDGFLGLPADDGWMRPETAPRPVAELVGCKSSFVLLAAGGVGKTTVLDWLRSREVNSCEVNLLGLDRAAIRESLNEAVAAGGAAYVDALDHVALAEPVVFDIVEQVLKRAHARGVHWRFSCRPAAWSSRLGSVFRDLGFVELRLLPLTRSASCEVVAGDVRDPDQFLDAVVDANLGRLSASPMQLRAAARQWQLTGRLPESQVQSIDFEVARLLTETNPALPAPKLAIDRQYRLAGRLGAISVFCGVSAFSRTASFAPGAMSVAEFPSTPEPDEPGTPVSPADLATVLDTALFEAAPHATVSFRHQQYAEYLAAVYLSKRNIVRAQLSALLGTVNGVLPGPMVGLAGWLAAIQPDLVQDLVGDNALAFARSGVELAKSTRVTVVEALLAAAAVGDIDPEWGLDLSSLVYPGLERQLADHSRAVQQPAQVWWLARLVHAGECVGLVKTVLQLALDPLWPAWARRAAIAALKALGDDDDRRAMKALLRLDQGADPDDEILASAIDALYPEMISTDELLDALRPRRNDHLIGGYLVLLGDLAERIPAQDLNAVLAWAAERSGREDLEREYGRLLGELVRRGWAGANSLAVCDSLAALLAAVAGPPSWGLRTRLNGFLWTEDVDVERRRLLAIAVAGRLNDETWHLLLQLGLLTAADADWLVIELPGLPSAAQRALANCVSPLLDQPTATQADRVLSLPPSHPAYEATRWWRDPIPVESQMADRLRRSHRYRRQDQVERAAASIRQAEQLSNALATATTDVLAWWRIAYWLAGDDSHGEALFTHDLTARSGWALLDENEQRLVLDLGWVYLHEHELQPSAWQGQETITTTEVLPDWCGVYLMTTLVRYDTARITGLRPTVWEAWAPAIVGAWNYDADEDAQLRCDLVDLAPAPARARIIVAAVEHLDALGANDRHLTPRPLFDHLCVELAPHIADRIAGEQFGDHLTASLLDLITRHIPQTAVEICRRLCENPGSSLHELARRKLAELEPAGAVASLTSSDAQPDEVAAIVPRIRFSDLDDSDLEAFCRLLLDQFPLADDPPMERFMFGSDVYETRRVRNRTLQLLGERGQVGRLDRLGEGRPAIDRQMIGYYQRAARTRAADLAYAHPQPEELLHLLGHSDARLVRHSSGLLSVIVEQLSEIQHDVSHGAFRDLWNIIEGYGAVPKSEDDISDWIRRQLQARLNGSVVDREVQVERPKLKGIGTRIDLTTTSPTATQPVGTARVIAEAKLISNDSLGTALSDQLVRQYLRPAALRHGIYLVYWIHPEQRPTTWTRKGPTDQAKLMGKLRQQANSFNDLEIVSFLLDISRPPT